MVSSLSIEELLQDILSIAQEYLLVQRVSVMLVDDGCLTIKAAVGLNLDIRDVRIPVGEGISGKVAESGKLCYEQGQPK